MVANVDREPKNAHANAADDVEAYLDAAACCLAPFTHCAIVPVAVEKMIECDPPEPEHEDDASAFNRRAEPNDP